MGSELVPFVFPETGNQIRTIMLPDGKPGFIAADVCLALALVDPSSAVRRLDDDEYFQVTPNPLPELPGAGPSAPPRRPMLAVTESGLYALVLGSQKPEAKRFRKWITSEVIPQIARTDGYGHPQLPGTFAEALQLAANQQLEIERQQAALTAATPKVEAFEAHVDTDGGITIRALAKQLADDGYQVNCRDMFALLHTIGIVYRQGDTWVPFESARLDGYATSRMDRCADGRIREVALVTASGVLEVRRRLSHLRRPGTMVAKQQHS